MWQALHSDDVLALRISWYSPLSYHVSNSAARSTVQGWELPAIVKVLIALSVNPLKDCLNSVACLMWRKRSIPTHSGWLYPLTFDAGKGLKEA